MRTGFPGILARAISVPSHFVLDTSISSLPHTSDPFKDVLSFQRFVVLFRSSHTIFVLVPGWRKVTNGSVVSGPSLIRGYRGRCDSVRGHGDIVVSDPEFEDSSISVHHSVVPVYLIIQLGVPPFFVYLATEINPGSLQHFFILLLDASVEVLLVLRLCFR